MLMRENINWATSSFIDVNVVFSEVCMTLGKEFTDVNMYTYGSIEKEEDENYSPKWKITNQKYSNYNPTVRRVLDDMAQSADELDALVTWYDDIRNELFSEKDSKKREKLVGLVERTYVASFEEMAMLLDTDEKEIKRLFNNKALQKKANMHFLNHKRVRNANKQIQAEDVYDYEIPLESYDEATAEANEKLIRTEDRRHADEKSKKAIEPAESAEVRSEDSIKLAKHTEAKPEDSTESTEPAEAKTEDSTELVEAKTEDSTELAEVAEVKPENSIDLTEFAEAKDEEPIELAEPESLKTEETIESAESTKVDIEDTVNSSATSENKDHESKKEKSNETKKLQSKVGTDMLNSCVNSNRVRDGVYEWFSDIREASNPQEVIVDTNVIVDEFLNDLVKDRFSKGFVSTISVKELRKILSDQKRASCARKAIEDIIIRDKERHFYFALGDHEARRSIDNDIALVDLAKSMNVTFVTGDSGAKCYAWTIGCPCRYYRSTPANPNVRDYSKEEKCVIDIGIETHGLLKYLFKTYGKVIVTNELAKWLNCQKFNGNAGTCIYELQIAVATDATEFFTPYEMNCPSDIDRQSYEMELIELCIKEGATLVSSNPETLLLAWTYGVETDYIRN